MRTVLPFCLLAVAVSRAMGQPPPQPGAVQISRISIDASDVPPAVRREISASFAHRIVPPDELATRVQRAFENQGYFRAHADPPNLTPPTEGHSTREVAVSIHVNAGTQYHLGQISFESGTRFSLGELRAAFKMHDGDLMSSKRAGDGLEQLRQLYATKGYLRFVATPELIIHEAERRIDLVMNLDEGRSFRFGQLFLQGGEPRVGAGKVLENAWKDLQGKQYDPSRLKSWLTANAAQWPGISDPKRTGLTPHDASETVDVKLDLP